MPALEVASDEQLEMPVQFVDNGAPHLLWKPFKCQYQLPMSATLESRNAHSMNIVVDLAKNPSCFRPVTSFTTEYAPQVRYASLCDRRWP